MLLLRNKTVIARNKSINRNQAVDHGRRKNFFPGRATRVFFYNFSRGGKSGEICFFPLETKKTTFFAEIFKIQGRQGPPLLPIRTPMLTSSCLETFRS